MFGFKVTQAQISFQQNASLSKSLGSNWHLPSKRSSAGIVVNVPENPGESWQKLIVWSGNSGMWLIKNEARDSLWGAGVIDEPFNTLQEL